MSPFQNTGSSVNKLKIIDQIISENAIQWSTDFVNILSTGSIEQKRSAWTQQQSFFSLFYKQPIRVALASSRSEKEIEIVIKEITDRLVNKALSPDSNLKNGVNATIVYLLLEKKS